MTLFYTLLVVLLIRSAIGFGTMIRIKPVPLVRAKVIETMAISGCII